MIKHATALIKDILQKIQDICADIVGVEPYDVTPGTYLLEDLGLNAGDVQTLFGALEEEFQTTIRPDQIEKVIEDDMTVLELITVVEAGL